MNEYILKNTFFLNVTNLPFAGSSTGLGRLCFYIWTLPNTSVDKLWMT